MLSPRGLVGRRGEGLSGKPQAMSDFDRQRLLSAVILLVIALFVSAATPTAARWRGPLRLAAIIGFFIALVLVLGEIALWLISSDR